MRFCFLLTAADRWRWSLLIVGLMLLVCVTVLIVYLLHDSVKSKFNVFLFFDRTYKNSFFSVNKGQLSIYLPRVVVNTY